MQEAIAKSVNATRRSRFAAPFRAFFGRALDVALPTLCPACREPVGGNGPVRACWSKLSLIAPPYCERLGIPFAYDPGPGVLSMEAIADPPAYHRARAAVRYDDIARALVHALKYGDRLDLAPTMGRWMARAGRELLADADALVPVPLHWRRLWARRFNQSALLAKAIAAGERHRRSPTRRSSASRRPRSRSGCRRPSARTMCRAPSACPPSARPRSPAAASFWSTTCSPPAPPRMPARGRCCGPAPRSVDRAGVRAGCRRGASSHINWLSKPRSNRHGPRRNLHHAVLPLLHRCQGAAEDEGRRLHRDRRVAATGSCERR